MGYTVRKSQTRAFIDHGWLKTYHTFSFATFYDPRLMGFRALRVINEDRVEPKNGFPIHEHENMEILTYVIEGQLAHKDSLGSLSVMQPGEVQLMHAGTGITHSEYNPSTSAPVHFLQIWILPDIEKAKPGYQQMLPKAEKNKWALLASKDGLDGSMRLYQDVNIFLLDLEQDRQVKRTVNRYGWIQLIQGSLQFDDTLLDNGDAIQIEPNTTITLNAQSPVKLLFFDLA